MDRLLIWDFDGTLGYRIGGMWSGALLEVVATAAPGLDVTAAQLGPFLQSGFPWHAPHVPHPELQSPAQWWDALDPVFAQAFEGVGIEPARARLLARMVRSIYPDPARWRLFDDTLAALSKLTQAGWSHVVLSNHVPELPKLAEHLGLLPHIVQVFCSARTGYEKPHPMAFRIVLHAFAQATRVWMLGDSMEVDIKGAGSVGIPGILVRRHHPEARYQCLGLAEIPDVICMTR